MPSLFTILSPNAKCKDDGTPGAASASNVGSRIICWLSLASYLFVRNGRVGAGGDQGRACMLFSTPEQNVRFGPVGVI